MKLKRKFADPIMMSILTVCPPWMYLFVTPVWYAAGVAYLKTCKTKMCGLICVERQNGIFFVVECLSHRWKKHSCNLHNFKEHTMYLSPTYFLQECIFYNNYTSCLMYFHASQSKCFSLKSVNSIIMLLIAVI